MFGIEEHGVAQPVQEACDPPAMEDLDFDPVTAHGWRIADGRAEAHPRVLGYIEWRDGVFEVMRFDAGFEVHEFETLDDAAEFVRRAGLAGVREHVLSGMHHVG